MESPVRICIGAALVVNLLLLSSTTVYGNALPVDLTSTTIKYDRTPKYNRINTTLVRHKPKTPDISLNELKYKESNSEENAEKNAKYKDRGRIKFNLKSSTESPLRRVKSSTSSAESAKLIIVTPTPEVLKPLQIIDSMRNYKKTKLSTSSSSTTPMPTEEHSLEEEYEDVEEDEKDTLEKYTSNKFQGSNDFFTIPSFTDDDFSHESTNERNKAKEGFSSPSYEFSSFPKDDSFKTYNDNHAAFKYENVFDFDTELTTPKNEFFDKKYQEISKSIINKIDAIKAKTSLSNDTDAKENMGSNRLSNTKPSNKSTIFIKNTKEIRVKDNEGSSSANNHLSDIQGTSIYYAMSVLSTETYAINSNDDDCDNDTLIIEPTVGTSVEKEMTPLNVTEPTKMKNEESAKPIDLETKSETISTLSSNYLPVSINTIFGSVNPSVNSLPISIQNNSPLPVKNSISSTERSIKVFTSNFSRNRSYSKRLNFNEDKDSPNNILPKNTVTTNLTTKPITRKFHYTTPKNKPIWMSPRRNVTKGSRPSNPTTVYSEYFNIRDKLLTSGPKSPIKTMLTTVSSEIDPVLQSDISGKEKVVHSQSIVDNTIPSLRKRGSTKYASSTETSREVEGTSEMEIPPTLTAWALASLRIPPVTHAINTTSSTQKNIDENELQKVSEVPEKEANTKSSTIFSTTISTISNDIIPKKYTEVNQNKLTFQTQVVSTSSTTNKIDTTTEAQSESLAAESNLTAQNRAETSSTEMLSHDIETEAPLVNNTNVNLWILAPTETEKLTKVVNNETILPVDATRSTGFESITKLPAEVTTPQDENIASSSELNHTTIKDNPNTLKDFEITTIRFSYVPTETDVPDSTEIDIRSTTEIEVFESTQKHTKLDTTAPSSWDSVVPTRTTIHDEPITTYRPHYMTTTEMMEELTTLVPETTKNMVVSSQIVENVTETEKEVNTTDLIETTTETVDEYTEIAPTTTTPIVRTTTTTEPTTVKFTTEENSTEIHIMVPTTTEREITSIVVEVVTEINTEKNKISTTDATDDTDCTSEESSESNEVMTKKVQTVTTPVATSTSAPLSTEVLSSTSEETITEKTLESLVTTETNARIFETSTTEEVPEITDPVTKSVSDLEDLTSYGGETTTASPRVLTEEAGSGAAVAITVSTIGVIALVLLIGLLLVVRRRGRRGVYAQRCTPVSLDAYSLDSVSVGHRKGNHRLRASKRSYGNPAYDDEVTSHPMQYAALASFALDVDSITAEFSEIPAVTVRPDEVPPGCEDKNRYSNVLPLPDTRVPLKRIGNDSTTEYINANYITGPGNIKNYYIACQAPLSNTVGDFWRMIWEQNSRLIVMLTEYMENGVEKCYEYLPPSEISDNKRIFGEFKIILKKREQHDKYAVSSVQLINLTTRTWREITHLWYFWPAKGVPEDYDSIIDFLFEMRNFMKISQAAKEYDEEGVEVIYGDQNRSSFSNLSKFRDERGSGNGINVYSPAKAEEQMKRGLSNNGTLGRMKAASEIEGVRPCVVTCASGAGRSATVIALDVCARALAAAPAASVDVPRVVRELRAQRPHALSNRHHYVLLYKVLSEYGNKMMGNGVDTI